MFTRILVPTDFSEPSGGALAHARSLARTFGASLHILHIVEDQSDSTLTNVLDQARAKLSGSIPAEDRARFRITTDVIVGTAARTIVGYASDNGYDLIVMGTHGRSGMAHLLMGSVAEHVVRTAHCPVLTVRDAPASVALPVRASTGRIFQPCTAPGPG